MFVCLRRVYFPECLTTCFVVLHAAPAGGRCGWPGPRLASCSTVARHINKQREWLIAGSKRLQWVTGPAADSWMRGGIWRREQGCGIEKEERGCTAGSVCLGSYSGLHYSSWDTEQSTIYTLGLRHSCELQIFFSVFLSLTLSFPLSVSEPRIHGVCWIFALMDRFFFAEKYEGQAVTLYTTLPLHLSTPPFLFRLSFPPRLSFFLLP